MSPVVDIVIPSRGDSLSRRQLLQDIERERQGVRDSITVTVEEGPSAAANRNAGARQGSAPWIGFLDDDIRLPDSWLSSLLAVCASNSAPDLFSGPIGSVHPRNIFSMASEDFLVRHKWYQGTGWYLVAAMIIIRRSAFTRLGGFDEDRAFGGEDWDLCQRAHTLELAIGLVDTVSCQHANPTRFADLMRRARPYSRWEASRSGSDEVVQQDIPQVPTGRNLVARVLSWPTLQYRDFRLQGRSTIRSLTSTALYVPWMASYLFHARRGHER